MHSHGSSSSSTSSNDDSAYPWILEHILAYPGTYEIPLRTMYTLNSTPPAQQPSRPSRAGTPSLSSSASSPDGSPQSPEFPLDQQHQLLPQDATDHFKSCLMTHISQLPSQPFSLPPSFIASFIRKCFTSDLCLVDFTQALTAMDYLKDLEKRRKRELMLTLQRLGLHISEDGRTSPAMDNNPKIREWVTSQQAKERKVEGLYTQVYIGLRRWTLINEMRFEPFNKANCIAMLNTLYPPTTTAPPTRQLTTKNLTDQRSGFFRYITAVEKNGKDILNNLEQQGAKEGDMNGWSAVRDVVDKYLRTANGVIEECMEVEGIEYFEADSEAFRRNERRADSGVSFATGDRPSTSDSATSKSKPQPSLTVTAEKPLPKSPSTHPAPPPCPPTEPLRPAIKKRTTTLERIAREFRNLRNRNDVKEMPGRKDSFDNKHSHQQPHPAPPPPPQQPRDDSKDFLNKSRSLRKMKSTTSVRDPNRLTQHYHSRTNSDEPMPDFDFDAKRRQLLLAKQMEKEREKQIAMSLQQSQIQSQRANGVSFDLPR